MLEITLLVPSQKHWMVLPTQQLGTCATQIWTADHQVHHGAIDEFPPQSLSRASRGHFNSTLVLKLEVLSAYIYTYIYIFMYVVQNYTI